MFAQRGGENRLGLAVQLCALRFLRFVPDELAGIPEPALRFVCEQTESQPHELLAYMRPGREWPSYCWHISPNPDCDCGLYAWHAVTAIAAHGILEVHAEGFRAELARPVLFAYDEGAGNRDEVELLGLLHGIPTCDYAQLAERSLEFGRVAPAWLLPICR